MKRDFKSVNSLASAASSNFKPAAGNPNSAPTIVLAETKHRVGTVLDSSTIIKVDDYLFRRQSRAQPNWFPRRISGADELRLIEGTTVLGVAQPSVSGVRGILDALQSGRNALASQNAPTLSDRRKVLWINLREEPLLYLNGRPVVLRDRNEPFRNMETFRGINADRLKDLEWRLKEDVVAEAQRCGGSILMHDEEIENQLTEKWESAPPSAVMTAEDVFFQLRQEGYRVMYERIPCTSGRPPSPAFFDEILRCVANTDRETWIIFNCQSGNARSTLASIATYSIQARRGFWGLHRDEGVFLLDEALSPDKKKSNQKTSSLSASTEENVLGVFTPPPPSTPGLQAPLPAATPATSDEEKDDTTKQLSAGWYLPVLQMLRLVLGGGREAKARMDVIIDRCAHSTNLRTEVLHFRAKAANCRDKSYRSLFMSRASVALQRYMLLILWEAYLAERSVRESLAQKQSSLGAQYKAGSFEEPALGKGSLADLESLSRALRTPEGLHQRSLSNVSDGTVHFPFEPASFAPDYKPSFTEWLESRREMITLFKYVGTNTEQALEGPDDIMFGEQGSSESRMVMQARRGVMLNTDTILKLDDFEHQDVDMEPSKGGRNFRRVPGMRVYGVSTPTVSNAKTLIRILRTSHGAESLLFCNLREEPFVYVNEKPFVLRSIHRPFRNLDAFADIDVKRLEKAEETMKKEILNEASGFGGKILVHVENADGSLKVVWEDIEDEDAVQTPKEVFANFSQGEMLPVSYVRVPITPESEPGLSDIDDLLHVVRASKNESGTHFVFFCQRGRGRSTMATIVACLELDEFVPTDDSESLNLLRATTSIPSDVAEGAPAGLLDAFPDRDALLSPVPLVETTSIGGLRPAPETSLKLPASAGPESDVVASVHTDFPPMLSLMRVLRHGTMSKRWLDATIDRCGAVFNLRKSVLAQSQEAASARSEEQSTALNESALLDLRKYFVLLEVAGYCMEVKGRAAANSTFRAWCSARPELVTLKDEIHDKSALQVLSHNDDASSYIEPGVIKGNGSDTATQLAGSNQTIFDRTLVANRKGRVLVRGSILKTDHFPGCRRLPDAKVEIEGAPNFRSVWPEGKVDDLDLRVYGTGIPTESGLRDILQLLTIQSSEKQVVWINLREEPILYVNGRPFVLRRLDEPFANLEHTGISRHRVEEMEIRFKDDVLDEARASPDGSVLIHEEDETGGLRPKWERIEAVLTSKELFESVKAGCDLYYWRIPITDEQSPKPSALDAIVDIVAATKSTSHLVFNCQMGRGRTTTGLVVGCATRLRMMGSLKKFATLVDEKIAPTRKFRSKIRAKPLDLPENVSRELRGDFLAIMAQLRLMDDGPEAKRAMDALIDICDAMQNLREAVHEVKVRSTKVDLSPAVRAEALGVAEHYLKRYAHLVQFTAYLLSQPDLSPKRMRFAAWLKSRPELGNALKFLIGSEKKSLLSS